MALVRNAYISRREGLRWAAASIAVFLWLTTVNDVTAQTKVALVIGNNSYEHQIPLSNPGRDAQLIGAALKRIGFDLVGGAPLINLNKISADKMVEAFGVKARQSDIALFYFSGYGKLVAGTNYLLPVDFAAAEAGPLNSRALALDFVLETISTSRAPIKIILIDAKGQGGLAPMTPLANTIIGFAAQPNATATAGPAGGNSPYAAALARMLSIKGLPIDVLFNEVGLEVLAVTKGKQQPSLSYSPLNKMNSLNPGPNGPPKTIGHIIIATAYDLLSK